MNTMESKPLKKNTGVGVEKTGYRLGKDMEKGEVETRPAITTEEWRTFSSDDILQSIVSGIRVLKSFLHGEALCEPEGLGRVLQLLDISAKFQELSMEVLKISTDFQDETMEELKGVREKMKNLCSTLEKIR